MFCSSQVRLTAKTMLFLLAHFHRHFKSLYANSTEIALLFLNSFLLNFLLFFTRLLTFKNCIHQGYYTANSVNYLTTFRNNLSVLSSRSLTYIQWFYMFIHSFSTHLFVYKVFGDICFLIHKN